MFSDEESRAGVFVPMLKGYFEEPVHTRRKAELVAEYVRLFQHVTHHGTYIDGFAGPQAPEDVQSWAARLVLELEPPWLRHFYLYDADAERYEDLEDLRAAFPEREIIVEQGDFNVEVDKLLGSGVIGEREATFCLLDQRTFECQWSTVEKLAHHKRGYKIELFYFLAHGWMERAVKGTTLHKDTIDRWWGGTNWKQFMQGYRGERQFRFAERFVTELGYRFAQPFPIYSADHQGATMYYMILASDHPEAPKFMARAYQEVIKRALPERDPRQTDFLSEL